MKNVIIVLVLFFGGCFIIEQCNSTKRNENESKIETPKEQISCMICGKNLTDDYNRICPNGKGYFCTPCYQKTMYGIDNSQSEGYNNSESDYTYDNSTTVNESQDESGYTTGSDGRVYENASCSLCGGTGIETATARNATTGEYESRVCPQCGGAGHQNY